MSGKGSNNQSGSSGSKSSSSSGGGGNSGGGRGSSGGSSSEPTVVSGHEYHTYGDRYSYIGKDDDGTPEFIDNGRKGGR